MPTQKITKTLLDMEIKSTFDPSEVEIFLNFSPKFDEVSSVFWPTLYGWNSLNGSSYIFLESWVSCGLENYKKRGDIWISVKDFQIFLQKFGSFKLKLSQLIFCSTVARLIGFLIRLSLSFIEMHVHVIWQAYKIEFNASLNLIENSWFVEKNLSKIPSFLTG